MVHGVITCHCIWLRAAHFKVRTILKAHHIVDWLKKKMKMVWLNLPVTKLQLHVNKYNAEEVKYRYAYLLH